ncbi:MAG: DUF1361 domain-containing protein [Verrucomicrobiota bacterium]
MKLLKVILKPETFAPVMAMSLASVVSSALVIIQVLAAETLRAGLQRHAYLIWNLFLAWIPLAFALLVYDHIRSGRGSKWRLAFFGGGWLVFFPNAPYIFTDLVHISAATSRHYWADLAMILACSLTGLLLWFVSLYLMQELVTQKFSRRMGWWFVTLMAALTSFGIYLGRFHRFNSWDVVTKPSEVYEGISSWASGAKFYQPTVTFPISFTVFLFLAYLMLYALTHLSPPRLAEVPQSERS